MSSSPCPTTDARRDDPRTLPPCPKCGTTDTVHVATRTDYVLYLRCEACPTIWSIPKPGVAQFGS